MKKRAFTQSCHCEGAAHGVIVDDYRFNAPCHCEECHRHDEAISLNKVDSMPRDCHAAPSAPLSMTWNEKRKAAFTLAETLITLMVIGVVAALTIPALMQQINGYTLQKQKDVFSKKWQEGLRQMRVDGKLENSYTTAEFVNEMGKYFKIQAVCDSNNLSGCFAEKITSYENGEAEEFDVKDLKSAKNFNKSEEDSPVYGIRFSDGTSMLLAYKKDCKGISEGDTQGNHTQCLLYVYDVNANKSPNSYGGNTGAGSKKTDSEIATMNKGRDMVGNASITKGNAFGLDFEIIGDVFKPSSLPDCSGNDYWQCAVDHCKSQGGSLPSIAQLQQIAEKVYENCTLTYDWEDDTDSKEYDCSSANLSDNPLWQKITGGNSYASLWSSVPNFGDAYYRDFYEDSSYCNPDGMTGYSDGSSALCVK